MRCVTTIRTYIMRKMAPIPHPESHGQGSSHKTQHSPSMTELLTENEGYGSALPWSQQHEGVRQSFNERGLLEAVMAVVGMAVNWLGVHALHGNGREGHDRHSYIVDRWSGAGYHVLNRNKVRMIDGLQSKQLPETVRDVYRSFTHGVACAATRLDGRGDLNAIQAILGRRGRVVEIFPGRTNLIRR